MHTQVAIIGAGPAGLFLSHLLYREGIDCVVIEARSRGYVEVEATLSDGRHETVQVDQAPGHPCRELTWDEITAKFMDCAAQARIDPGKAKRALTILEGLDTCTDIGQVVALLH